MQMPWWKVGLLFLLVIILILLNLIKYILKPIWRFLLGSRVPVVVRTPEERFENLDKLGYNFQPNYLSIDAGCGVKLPRVHFVDEGPRDGHVILCLHGEPSWSFLYRKMVPILVKAGYRVIVPDFIGFGKSDKYTNPDNYTHELHTMVLRKLLDHLDVTNMTLVCQDWGGLTGLSVVKDAPQRFSDLVIMNTGLPSPVLDLNDDYSATPGSVSIPVYKKIIGFLPFCLWRTFVLLIGTNLPVTRLFNMMYKGKVDQAVIDAYGAPFPSRLFKAGAARWPLLVPMLKDDPVTAHLEAARNCLKTWRKPVLVMFGDKDPITKSSEALFLNLVPHHTRMVVEGAGHFLQETHGEILSENIIQFLNKK